MDSLQAGVLRERGACFVGLRNRRKIAQRHQLGRGIAEDATDLGELVAVGRRDHQAPDARAHGGLLVQEMANELTLEREQLADAAIAKVQKPVQCLPAEGQRFRRSLELDVEPRSRLDDIHVDIGFRVF